MNIEKGLKGSYIVSKQGFNFKNSAMFYVEKLFEVSKDAKGLGTPLLAKNSIL